MADVGNVTLSFEPNRERIVRALLTEDVIGTVMRCHIEVDRSARHALSVLSQRQGVIKRPHYLGHVMHELEQAKVHANFIEPLRILNKLRNKFAHHRKEDLLDSDLLNLFAAVKQVYPKFDEDFRMRVSGSARFDRTYGECSLKEKLTILSTVASTLMASVPDLPPHVWEAAD